MDLPIFRRCSFSRTDLCYWDRTPNSILLWYTIITTCSDIYCGIQYFGHQCKELTHLKRLRCWERLKAGGEGDDRGWDGWMASPTQQTWVWASSRSGWWTGKPGVLQSMRLQRAGYDSVTELNWMRLPLSAVAALFHLNLWKLRRVFLRIVCPKSRRLKRESVGFHQPVVEGDPWGVDSPPLIWLPSIESSCSRQNIWSLFLSFCFCSWFSDSFLNIFSSWLFVFACCFQTLFLPFLLLSNGFFSFHLCIHSDTVEQAPRTILYIVLALYTCFWPYHSFKLDSPGTQFCCSSLLLC